MDKAKIERINYLARQSRERELTDEEKKEAVDTLRVINGRMKRIREKYFDF